MEKNINIGEKNYTVKEVKFKDIANFKDLDGSESMKKLVQLATEITEEEYNELTIREGTKLVKAINELNGLGEIADFQNAPK